MSLKIYVLACLLCTSSAFALRQEPRKVVLAFIIGDGEEHEFAETFLSETAGIESEIFKTHYWLNEDDINVLHNTHDPIFNTALTDVRWWDILNIYDKPSNKASMHRCIEIIRRKKYSVPFIKCARKWLHIKKTFILVSTLIDKIKDALAADSTTIVDIILEIHGNTIEYTSGYTTPTQFVSIFNRLLQFVDDSSSRIDRKYLISCGVPSNMPMVRDFGWQGCFDMEGAAASSRVGTVVNWTPWGLFAKSISSRHNLEVCYYTDDEVATEESFLLNMCRRGNKSVSTAEHFMDNFKGVDRDLISKRDALLSSLFRLVMSTVPRSLSMPKHQRRLLKDFFYNGVCALATGNDDEVFAKRVASTVPHGVDFDLWSLLIRQNNRTKGKHVQFKDAEKSFSGQLRAFLEPFRKLWRAQPSHWARSWLYSAPCAMTLTKYMMSADAQRNECARRINEELGVGALWRFQWVRTLFVKMAR